MQKISLNGTWQASQVGKKGSVPAVVPGCIHTALLEAGKIKDPFYRDNELDCFWVDEADWFFEHDFRIGKGALASERVILRCEGLDTLATIHINGRKLGTADNMHRTWEFDAKSLLKLGENTIKVTFASATKFTEAQDRKRHLPNWILGMARGHHSHVRKEACNFGWDWGISTVTCGVWRSIELVAYDTARLGEVRVVQDHSSKKSVGLDISVSADVVSPGKLVADVKVSLAGKVVAEGSNDLRSGKCKARVAINGPELWWPNNMGEHLLYKVEVLLRSGEGKVLDRWTRNIGLRTLELDTRKDQWGQSFHFVVNGVPFFSKGANWIPSEALYDQATRDSLRDLVKSAADANMNMLRVWGGGYYEDDAFYELCDEHGICIWQDFMFACATYPTYDKDFVANVEAEAVDNIKRLRHHACMAVWCGNNELEQGLVDKKWTKSAMSWTDYGRLFDKLLPALVKQHDGITPYWPSSPHTPVGDRRDWNSPESGDAHLWSVWHGGKPFEWYRTCDHRFNSEFGFQSFTEPKTSYSFTKPEDRNVTSYVMEHHQRCGTGNSKIMNYMLSWFRLPKGFDETLWASQILQGMAIKYACEHWRRSMPRGMGTLYWQLNDCWPVASWASIDYHHRWKALHYMARKFYAPLLVSGLEDPDKGTVEVHVTHDGLETRDLTLKWFVTDARGKELEKGSKDVRAGKNCNRKVHTLNLTKLIDEQTTRDCIIWLELYEGRKRVSDNMVTFARPKHLELSAHPRISAKISGSGTKFKVALSCKEAALWAWMELVSADFRASDNFVHLRPGARVTLSVTTDKPMSLVKFKAQFSVSSLVDLG